MKELIFGRTFILAIQNFRDNIAVIDGEYQATFEQHGDRVLRLVSVIQGELGLTNSDRFAVMSVNGHKFLELYHAALLGAAVITPLNLRLAAKELAFILEDSEAKTLFVDQFFVGLIKDALTHTPCQGTSYSIVLLDGGDEVECAHRYDDLLSDVEPLIPEEPEEEDPVLLMYTGGTTGRPKGVILSHRATALNCYHFGLSMGLQEPDEVYLVQIPMFHISSIPSMMLLTATGGTQVLTPFFEPGSVLDLVKKHSVTQTGMVPTMISMLVNHPEFTPDSLKSLRLLVYGAAPMPPALLKSLAEMFPDLQLAQAYGMTESSSFLTVLSAADHKKGGVRLSSVGRPVAGVELSIQDDKGTQLPRGQTGEICARGGNFMSEYLSLPEQTSEVFRNGWYLSGDAGYLDESGYLFLADRVKDMIITGGENVYSVEVENAISAHTAVDQVAVIGIPDKKWGEAVHAIIVLKEDAEPIDEQQLIDFAKESIAAYKCPKSIEFRNEALPLSGAMKVVKKDLRAPYWEGVEQA